MNIIQQLDEALANAEPNIIGNRYAKIEVGDNVYSAASSTSSSRHSAQAWGRVDYRMNGKRISKAKLLDI